MEQLTESAPAVVPNVLTAGITISNGGRIFTVASADARGRLVDERQYDVDDGPCLQSMPTREIVDVPAMSLETH